jgi:hypothetical protein
MGIGRQRIAAIFRLAVLVAISLVGATSQSFAARQLLLDGDCNFVVDVPGIFSTSHLEFRAQKGTTYTENEDGKFCGQDTMSTPMGDATSENCYEVNSGRFISGSHSNKVSSSTCTLSDANRLQTAFSPADFAPWSGAGPATLHGQAFLRTVGGDVKTCAGSDVLLLPATPYVDEMIAKGAAGEKADSRALSLIRHTICDAQGNFSFAGLPAQRWYVLTKVTWGIPHIEYPGERPGLIGSLLLGIPSPPLTDEQGGELLQAVALQPGENQAFLTDRDRR